jgi:hypothetical protein
MAAESVTFSGRGCKGCIPTRGSAPGTAIRVKMSAGIGVNRSALTFHCPCFLMRYRKRWSDRQTP